MQKLVVQVRDGARDETRLMKVPLTTTLYFSASSTAVCISKCGLFFVLFDFLPSPSHGPLFTPPVDTKAEKVSWFGGYILSALKTKE